MLARDRSSVRTIQVVASPFGRTEKVFYIEEPMLPWIMTHEHKNYFGKMPKIGRTHGFNVRNESNFALSLLT